MYKENYVQKDTKMSIILLYNSKNNKRFNKVKNSVLIVAHNKN